MTTLLREITFNYLALLRSAAHLNQWGGNVQFPGLVDAEFFQWLKMYRQLKPHAKVLDSKVGSMVPKHFTKKLVHNVPLVV